MPNVPFSWRAYSQWTNPVPPRLVTKALQVNPVSSESPYPREGLIKSTYNEWISYLQNHLCNSAFCFIVWDVNNILLSLPKYFDSKAQWYKMSTYAHRFCGLGTQTGYSRGKTHLCGSSLNTGARIIWNISHSQVWLMLGRCKDLRAPLTSISICSLCGLSSMVASE